MQSVASPFSAYFLPHSVAAVWGTGREQDKGSRKVLPTWYCSEMTLYSLGLANIYSCLFVLWEILWAPLTLTCQSSYNASDNSCDTGHILYSSCCHLSLSLRFCRSTSYSVSVRAQLMCQAVLLGRSPKDLWTGSFSCVAHIWSVECIMHPLSWQTLREVQRACQAL